MRKISQGRERGSSGEEELSLEDWCKTATKLKDSPVLKVEPWK